MTIYDVAKAAGVSVATVSRVLNHKQNLREETRRKVQAVLDACDYTPSVLARGLANSTLHLIGMLVVDIRNQHHSDIAFTIEQEFAGWGYGCILCNTGAEPKKQEGYLRTMAARKVDGVVLVGSVFQSEQMKKLLAVYFPETPVVMTNGYLPLANVRGVLCDEYSAAIECVAHLAGKGHRRIAFLRDNDTPSNQQKLEGYREGLRRCGLAEEEGLLVSQTSADFYGGYAAAGTLLGRGCDFSAVLCSEDATAAGAVKRLVESGRKVPEEVEVIGYNNSVIAKLATPDLTSVDNQMQATGKAAARMLYDMLCGAPTPQKMMLSAEVVYRGSSPKGTAT